MKGYWGFGTLKLVNRSLAALFAVVIFSIFCSSSAASSHDTDVTCEAEPSYAFSLSKDDAMILYGAGVQNVYDFIIGELLLYDGQELTASLSGGDLLHTDGVHTLEYALSFACVDPIAYSSSGSFPINVTVDWKGCIGGLYTAPLVLTVADKATGSIVWRRSVYFQAYLKENRPHDDDDVQVPAEPLVTLVVAIVNDSTGEITHNGAIVKNGDVFILKRLSAMLFQITPNDGYYIESVTLNGETIFCPITGGLISTGLLTENSTLEVRFQSRVLNPPRTGDRDTVGLIIAAAVCLLLLLLLIFRRKKDDDNGRDGLYLN